MTSKIIILGTGTKNSSYQARYLLCKESHFAFNMAVAGLDNYDISVACNASEVWMLDAGSMQVAR